ncbi:MAG: hypothetical protein Q9162_005819 [Coniocarpon cinnabarinum]
MAHKEVIGLLGGGQLGRMFVESANRLNVKVEVLDQDQAPAKQISNREHIAGSFQNPEKIQDLANRCDNLTVEIEHVDTVALQHAEAKAQVHPSWRTLRTIQDKFAQKVYLSEARVRVAKFTDVETASTSDLEAAGHRFGFPFMLKAKTQAYDGRGNFLVRNSESFDDALKCLDGRPLYAEKWVPFVQELAVMVVKTKDGVLSFPTVETIHEDSICKLCYAPARRVSPEVNQKAQDLARAAVAAFSGKGVFGVEMFLLEDNTVLVNEIAPRPHNSGHYTIEACPLSQYDAHLRALLDIPIHARDLRIREPAIMLNILGGADPTAHLELVRAAENIGGSIHLYGKGDARPGRKMGHITLTAPTMYEAEHRIQPLIELSTKLRAARSDLSKTSLYHINSPPPAMKPPVAITTGSQSDQPKLQPCYDLLKELGIPCWRRITSAHRTPDHMAKFAREAESNGVRVIIAAAGGAAHLPGMVAAHTTLPVIGVPIILRGDGMDSVLSILNMPSGVPVATVAADRAANAALLAARILASTDPAIDASLKAWIAKARQTSLETDTKLQEEDGYED